MEATGLLVTLEARPGKEAEAEALLKLAQPLALNEKQTLKWYAFKLGPAKFGIFDTFANEGGRNAHLAGEIAKALGERASELLTADRKKWKSWQAHPQRAECEVPANPERTGSLGEKMTTQEKQMKTSQTYRPALVANQTVPPKSALGRRIQRLGLALLAFALVVGATGSARAASAGVAQDEAAVRGLGDNFAKGFVERMPNSEHLYSPKMEPS